MAANPFGMPEKQLRELIKRAQAFQKEADEKGYGRQPQRSAIPQFPHCDTKVLHAPGECEFCDTHPDWQELREVWGIRFTGHSEPGKVPCPAERERDIDTINRWGGNRTTVHLIPEEPDAV